MVLTMRVSHLFKYPAEIVAQTHLTKYPTEKETNVVCVKEVERKQDQTGTEYIKRIAVCLNVVPSFLRKFAGMDVNTINIEEQCWFDRTRRTLTLQTRNLTWSSNASLYEESCFAPAPQNAHWTSFEQHGIIDIHGMGRFGRVLEVFAHHFLQRGAQKSLQIMEELLQEWEQKTKRSFAAVA